MSVRKKRPGGALQRTTGANVEERVQSNSSLALYATLAEKQSRHLRVRCGLSDDHARLVAALCFGEDQ
jgi:hypothetical protein